MDYFGYAYFVERPRRIEDLTAPHTLKLKRPYRIVTEIQLPAIDYENFITDMLADRQFIEDHGRRCKKGEVWDCLLIRRRGQPDGVLVMPEGGCFVGWAAYCLRRPLLHLGVENPKAVNKASG